MTARTAGRTRRCASRRSGVTLAEISIALLLVGVAVTMIAELSTTMLRQQRNQERRLVAMQEAANVLEDVGGWKWDELTAERAAGVKLSPHAEQSLLDAELRVTVGEDSAAPISARRIDVVITWRGAVGGDRLSTELSVWRFAP